MLNNRFNLATKFLTKRVVNIDLVSRTFKPLWRRQNDFKINDMRDSILFLDFEDERDLQRVVEHEPWTYDKHLVIFERIRKNVSISDLRFRFTSFWIQIHDLSIHCLTSAVRESIGGSLGQILHMTDSEGKEVKEAISELGSGLMSQSPLAEFVRFGQKENSLDGQHWGMNVSLIFATSASMFPMTIATVSDGFKAKEHSAHYGDWLKAKVDLSTRKALILVTGEKPTKSMLHPTASKDKDESAKFDPEFHGASSSIHLRQDHSERIRESINRPVNI